MQPIKKIVIVGGGSAGWMSAAYLQKALNNKDQQVDISLIEASDINTVGVGEATIPMFSSFFGFLGIPEKEWMKACQASYKLGIKFEKWVTGDENDTYWHPFGNIPINNGPAISMMHYWLNNHLQQKETLPFAKAINMAVYAAEKNKAPKSAYTQQKTPKANLSYAYHLDAGLLVKYLKNWATTKGVTHKIGTIEHIHLNDQGYIDYITSDKQEMLEADLFIDCSGSHSRLIEKALHTKHISYSDCLLTDSAIAIGTPYGVDNLYNEQNGGLNAYTTATAKDAGWVWHTPLQTRSGNGYVYSSAFVNESEAEKDFRQFLGENAEGQEARFLKMRVGRMEKLWVKNCVAIGMSGGFIEPLESTGLALIQIGLNNLVEHFPDTNFQPWLIKEYNRKMIKMYDHIRDFIVLHYILTKREDTPFWKAVKMETKIPESLQAKLTEWKHHWLGQTEKEVMFTMFSYTAILTGMNYLPEQALPITQIYRQESVANFFKIVEQKGEQLVKTLPSQVEYFKKLEEIKAFKTNKTW